MFGNVVTELTTSPPQQQLAMFISAPIGQQVNPKYIRISLGNSDNTVSAEVAEGATVSVGGATVTRRTYPPANEWPSRNGTYSVTLTGDIPVTISVTAMAATKDGHVVTEEKLYK
jgi:hypothetical protein